MAATSLSPPLGVLTLIDLCAWQVGGIDFLKYFGFRSKVHVTSADPFRPCSHSQPARPHVTRASEHSTEDGCAPVREWARDTQPMQTLCSLAPQERCGAMSNQGIPPWLLPTMYATSSDSESEAARDDALSLQTTCSRYTTALYDGWLPTMKDSACALYHDHWCAFKR